jgi:hypothetical protein
MSHFFISIKKFGICFFPKDDIDTHNLVTLKIKDRSSNNYCRRVVFHFWHFGDRSSWLPPGASSGPAKLAVVANHSNSCARQKPVLYRLIASCIWHCRFHCKFGHSKPLKVDHWVPNGVLNLLGIRWSCNFK